MLGAKGGANQPLERLLSLFFFYPAVNFKFPQRVSGLSTWLLPFLVGLGEGRTAFLASFYDTQSKNSSASNYPSAEINII